jgi:CHASE3 domain sensor protein
MFKSSPISVIRGNKKDSVTFERLVGSVLRAEVHETGHLILGEDQLLTTVFGQRNVS